MAIPIINTSATDIELTKERQGLITQKLAPLARLLPGEREVVFDVVVRQVQVAFGEDMFYVSAKLTTERGEFISAAIGYYLTRVLGSLREDLRKKLSRGESVGVENGYVPKRQKDLVAKTA